MDNASGIEWVWLISMHFEKWSVRVGAGMGYLVHSISYFLSYRTKRYVFKTINFPSMPISMNIIRVLISFAIAISIVIFIAP